VKTSGYQRPRSNRASTWVRLRQSGYRYLAGYVTVEVMYQGGFQSPTMEYESRSIRSALTAACREADV